MASCDSAVSCTEGRAVRPTYASRYGPASDAEFLRSIAGGGGVDTDGCTPQAQRTKVGRGPAVVDSYSCRQMYLKSYVFVRKETVREKTRRYVDTVRERTGDLPLLHLHRRRRSSGGGSSFDDGGSASFDASSRGEEEHAKNKKGAEEKAAAAGDKKKPKRCAKVMWLLLRRLLSCTTRVDAVADRNSSSL